jgi:SAM-dependent methyltransferase
VTTDGEPGPQVSGDSRLQSFTLESLTSAVNYHRWVTDLLAPYLGDDPLEIGSGLGDYARTWLDDGLAKVTVSDLDPHRLQLLRERFAADPRASVEQIDVFTAAPARHSSAVAVNVLEHIQDDSGALSGMARLVAPGGVVAVFVPAFPFAMSRFDREVGHFRRYRAASLSQAFETAGLRVERLHYVNAPGLFAWFAGMRLLRMTPQDGVTVRLWDRFVVPVARAVEGRVRPPFGQSLLAVGRVDH